MKKKLLILTLSLGLLAIGATSAFADSTDVYGRGHMLFDSGKTVEEIQALKIERIDQLVKDGNLTAEEASKYKELIKERQATCDGLGTNRDDNERLGMGFGNGLKDGTGNATGRNGGGRGNHGGFRSN